MNGKTSFIFVTILLSLALQASRVAGQSIKVGYTSQTIFFLPFFVAMKKGFYTGENLNVDLVQMGSPSVNLQALVAGQIHLSAINPDGIIIFNERGGNLKAIAGVINGVAYTLVGAKAYTKIEDLKGAKLGAASLKGGPTTFLLEYLRAKGLVYPRDYALVVVGGGTPARLAALETGAIAAGVLGIPHSEMAFDRGLNRLGDIIEIMPTFQFTTVNVDPAWANKNAATVVKFLKAHIKSLRWIYENLDEAADLYSRAMSVKQPYARRGIEYFTKHRLFPRDGSITLEGMKVNIDVQAKDGLLNPPLPSAERHVDLSYLKKAQAELGH